MYNPLRVLRQLGYDQRSVQISGDVSYSNVLVAVNKFVAKGKMEILAWAERIFCRGWDARV